MAELRFVNVLKIYPFTKISGILGRKKALEALERERKNPYTSNEGVIAVQKFNLDIYDGEFVVLLGPSGCGKSTLLRMIAGLEEISDGQILMDGIEINDVKPEDRDVSMIFQTYSLYPHFTVYENIAFPLKNLHIPRDELDAMVRHAAALLNLSALLDRRPKELSGGERQRVAIGRAIVRNPKLFLMDEPFSNLDAPLRQKLRLEIKNLHEKLGTTFVYVTHDQTEAFMLGTKIVVMRDGMIQQVGSPRDLFNRPANLYTAKLVGAPEMNIIENVSLRKNGDEWFIHALGTNFLLPHKKTVDLPSKWSDTKVTIGFRPVHVIISDEGIQAEVEYTEHMGSEINVYARVGNYLFSFVCPSGGLGFAQFVRGQMIHFQIPTRRFHLFDPATENRIV